MLESNNPIKNNLAEFNTVKSAKLDEFSQIRGNEDKLKKAAGEFEAVFINKILKVMDSTVKRSDFLGGNGQAESTFRSMMYQEISKDIASNPSTSFGLAKQVYEQMKDMV